MWFRLVTIALCFLQFSAFPMAYAAAIGGKKQDTKELPVFIQSISTAGENLIAGTPAWVSGNSSKTAAQKSAPDAGGLNDEKTSLLSILDAGLASNYLILSARPDLLSNTFSDWQQSDRNNFLFILSGFVLFSILIYAGILKSMNSSQGSGNYPYPDYDSINHTLKKEELIQEINLKNQELAHVSMRLIERGKLISKVREEIQSIIKNEPHQDLSHNFRSILRLLNDAEKQEQDWEQFAVHFDEVHRNFLAVLKSEFPVLSVTDLKLCAYLRLNLSSKEIAQSLNITVKGVEVSRYRLRKKLNLSKDVHLTDFLLQLAHTKGRKPDSLVDQPDELARFLSFFNQSMTAKYISQGGYNFSSAEMVLKSSGSANQ